ncbi:Zinc finger, CCCH-type [Nannochloropsis gaditana]|uniref:Zinc finger, CCCH-type n=1 Tax=Nannochloropsis gaditana TaxID=72520 RepID=W7TVW6_9STRA|nr:Zinc finger, CCCH-type [Nannochloropsis gaditana]
MEETTRFHEERLPESPRRQARDGGRLQLPHQQPPQEQGLDQHPQVATQQPEYGDGLHAFLGVTRGAAGGYPLYSLNLPSSPSSPPSSLLPPFLPPRASSPRPPAPAAPLLASTTRPPHRTPEKTPCRFHAQPGGCASGHQCKFLHQIERDQAGGRKGGRAREGVEGPGRRGHVALTKTQASFSSPNLTLLPLLPSPHPSVTPYPRPPLRQSHHFQPAGNRGNRAPRSVAGEGGMEGGREGEG